MKSVQIRSFFWSVLKKNIKKNLKKNLKRIWEARLQKRVKEFGIKHCLTISEFVNLTLAIWKERMKKENAISSFEKTGKIVVT